MANGVGFRRACGFVEAARLSMCAQPRARTMCSLAASPSDAMLVSASAPSNCPSSSSPSACTQTRTRTRTRTLRVTRVRAAPLCPANGPSNGPLEPLEPLESFSFAAQEPASGPAGLGWARLGVGGRRGHQKEQARDAVMRDARTEEPRVRRDADARERVRRRAPHGRDLRAPRADSRTRHAFTPPFHGRDMRSHRRPGATRALLLSRAAPPRRGSGEAGRMRRMAPRVRRAR